MQYIIIGAVIIGLLLLGGQLFKKDDVAISDGSTVVSGQKAEKIEIIESTDPKVVSFMANTDSNPRLVTTESGLQYAVLSPSDSDQYPDQNSTVEVHYHGTLENGETFDSSVLRGESISFPLNGVIRGWQEGIPLMNVGSKYRLIVPADLAYGSIESGHPLGGQDLIFDVELIAIK